MSIIPFIAASVASSSKRNKSYSKINKKVDWSECEIAYGEVCYKCNSNIGEPTGEPRLCVNCEPSKEKQEKDFLELKIKKLKKRILYISILFVGYIIISLFY